ncbi:homeobox protein ATH1-like isoform X1 [Zingiber officinale]|uniref:homeobox protein ATH1-like isoform X1 n=1 Tax=Zingiber officinale TaxID=94328 RepID=UPI001C4C2A91|nr:homeobox protein ATH1-like isoform X1 [Zingiber officinale]XP_042469157.1 homeobox protein ATH1-like isoform X1 [Zingiber officinale]XP_042469158.1 homeobox protein ATH1-like isoform X1 [Zingiber officinale]XP_042469159.1 homeobox protein ATH1-like isoform X1 [Zingiber officinale]XP_042469160.1 homeobox protein ATH1-like isoform X1 [Zingiber officinale]
MENDIFNGSFLNFSQSNMILDPTFGSFLQSGIPGNNIHRQMFAGNLFVSAVQDTATADVYLTSREASPFSGTSFSRTFTQIGNDSFNRSIANVGLREHFSGTSLSATSLANLLSSTTCVPENSTGEDMIVTSSLAASPHCNFGSPSDINLMWNQSELVGHQVPLGKTFSVVQPSYHIKKGSLPGWNCHDPNWNFWHAYGNPAPAPGSELSLSVGSCQPCGPCLTDAGNIADQCSEISCSAVTQVTSADSAHRSTEFQASNHANQSSLDDFCLRMAQKENNACTEKPSLNHSSSRFVQLSHMLSRSKYLDAVQEVLAEFATCALADFNNMNDSLEAKVSFSSSCSSTPEHPITVSELLLAFGQTETLDNVDSQMCQEANRKKSELLTMLQLVDHSYNHCLEQMQDVMASFVSLIQSSTSDRHARFALHSVSSLYKSLKRRITSLVILIAQQSGAEKLKGKEKNLESSLLQKQWALQQLKKSEQQSWRPQRGLPEKSVSVLRTWMFENFLHPVDDLRYPKDNEKHLLAIKSGLTRSQVSNWFINARVRLWKPMIEDMYSELNKKRTDEALDGESRSENGNLCGPSFLAI